MPVASTLNSGQAKGGLLQREGLLADDSASATAVATTAVVATADSAYTKQSATYGGAPGALPIGLSLAELIVTALGNCCGGRRVSNDQASFGAKPPSEVVPINGQHPNPTFTLQLISHLHVLAPK